LKFDKVIIEIKRLKHTDIKQFIELIHVFEDVFDMQNFTLPNQKHLQTLLEKEDFFVFVALQNEQVVGGLTSYIIHQYYSTSSLVYIYDLAVKAQMQREGIGKKLVEANNTYAKNIGAELVMVQAEEADVHALDFYRSTGAQGENVVHFNYST